MFNRVISIVLVLGILGAIGILAYTIASPPPGEKFSELYVLGPDRKAEGYPKELEVGAEGKVILGIVNRELEPMAYEVEWTLSNKVLGNISPIQLENGETWEKEITFIPQVPGDNQKLEFKLYKIRLLGNVSGEDTLLALWLGKDELSATLTNQGNTEAGYYLQVERQGPEGNQTKTESVGPVTLARGEEWKQEINYAPAQGASQIEFSAYRDEELLYKEKVKGGYPAVQLWIDVVESSSMH
jgi:hypothetical protein